MTPRERSRVVHRLIALPSFSIARDRIFIHRSHGTSEWRFDVTDLTPKQQCNDSEDAICQWFTKHDFADIFFIRDFISNTRFWRSSGESSRQTLRMRRMQHIFRIIICTLLKKSRSVMLPVRDRPLCIKLLWDLWPTGWVLHTRAVTWSIGAIDLDFTAFNRRCGSITLRLITLASHAPSMMWV